MAKAGRCVVAPWSLSWRAIRLQQHEANDKQRTGGLAAHTKKPSEIEPQNSLKMAGLQRSKIVIQKQLLLNGRSLNTAQN
jgi:hypothetical protein